MEDDGVGMTPASPAKGGGLGERIIGMMAQKLHAKVERDDAHSRRPHPHPDPSPRMIRR